MGYGVPWEPNLIKEVRSVGLVLGFDDSSWWGNVG